MLKKLDEYFLKAIETADSDPYKKDQYIKGFRAGLESARELVKSLEAKPELVSAPEEMH